MLQASGMTLPAWLHWDEPVEQGQRQALREMCQLAIALLRDRRVLRELQRRPGLWTSEIARATEISMGGVHRALCRLAADGLVHITQDSVEGQRVKRAWPGDPQPQQATDGDVHE